MDRENLLIRKAVGLFTHNLAAAGIDAKMVDMVIISHCHGDHVYGLLTAHDQPAFPNAEVLVPAAEWKFWSDDGEMSRAPAGRMTDLDTPPDFVGQL
jgi:metal-dependent hydrolase (beta-lactamase superfamily II)